MTALVIEWLVKPSSSANPIAALIAPAGSGGGDVVGPASAVDGHVALFDGATGKLIKDGGALPSVPTALSAFTNDSGYIDGTNPTITDYTETLYAPSANTAYTVDLANGTIQKLTSAGGLTITLPASVAGKSYLIIVAYGGAHTLTWAGTSAIKWEGGTMPTPTSVSGKFDLFSFICDGTNTYGLIVGQNF